jgi:hypothetical protein
MSYSTNDPLKTGTSGDVLRITAEDANSSHVDDLLKRHASLRGEQGISRDRGRKWYYQSWFILMIAGCAAAVLAYALLDPYYGEYLYIQGQVSDIVTDPSYSLQLMIDRKQFEVTPDRFVEAKVGGRIVAFTDRTKIRGSDGKYKLFNSDQLKAGQTLGVYVLLAATKKDVEENHCVATYIIPDGKPTNDSDVSLHDLNRHRFLAELLIFPMIAAFVGLFIGAVDGIMCRLWRRVLLAGAAGLIFGFVGGFVSGNVLASLVYSLISPLSEKFGGIHGVAGFSIQTAGRGFAWALAGMTMGLGQGIALRSSRLILYGFLGGLIGGLIGGLLFDPIDLLLLGSDKPSASVSRWVGFAVIGAVIGLMIGVVERLARDAWLRMVEGPLAGKEFLVFKDLMRMGSSPKSEIYLFNDPAVAASHAVIRSTGDIYEIENTCRENPACLNGRPITRARLRHGDRISLGRTSFLFQRQRGE